MGVDADKISRGEKCPQDIAYVILAKNQVVGVNCQKGEKEKRDIKRRGWFPA
jgi:hypothetical protein